MKISARNQFEGTVKNITEGAVNATVAIEIAGGEIVTSTISMAAVKELELEVGKDAVAVIKATSVMLGIGELKLSARNQFVGTVKGITEGAVNASVAVETASGNVVTSTITMAAVKELGIAVGSAVVAVVKATSVLVMA